MKPATIYGIDSTRGTALIPANNVGTPYDLQSPDAIGHAPGGNSYIDPNPYDASTNTDGGMEVWYRWGDTPGDCSTSIHDVKSKQDGVTDRDVAVVSGIAVNDATANGDGGWDDADEDLNGGIEAAPVVVQGTAGFNHNDVQIECADGQQFMRVRAPKLPFLRVKWSGGNSATVESALWYRRRKK